MVEERKDLTMKLLDDLLYGSFGLHSNCFMAVKYLDLPLKRFLYNQLYTQEGFVILILIIFLFVANIALLSLVINRV